MASKACTEYTIRGAPSQLLRFFWRPLWRALTSGVDMHIFGFTIITGVVAVPRLLDLCRRMQITPYLIVGINICFVSRTASSRRFPNHLCTYYVRMYHSDEFCLHQTQESVRLRIHMGQDREESFYHDFGKLGGG